jgi:hypothetical protein
VGVSTGSQPAAQNGSESLAPKLSSLRGAEKPGTNAPTSAEQAVKDDASKTQQQQPVVESGSRTDLPADADPVIEKNPSETVDPQHAIESPRATEPISDQGRIVDAEISTYSGSTSHEDNDAASKP